MDWLLAVLLFVHVGGAILAFGPPYTFMLLGPMMGREPAHANFALRFQERVSSRLVAPFALLQGVTGLLIVWRAGIDILAEGWLMVSIALYVLVLVLGFGVLVPTLHKLVAASAAPPPASAGSTAPAGPPPHIRALIDRSRLAGLANALLVLVIVFLMVNKPF